MRTRADDPVVDRIRANAERCFGAPFLTLVARDGTENGYSYAALVKSAERWARRYAEAGLSRGDVVIVVLEHSEGLYAAYLGALLGGQCPAYFAHPSEKIDEARYRESVRLVIETVGSRLVVTSPSILARLHGDLTQTAVLLDGVDAPATAPAGARRSGSTASDGALFLQFSSGTTGIKKGVAISSKMLAWQVAAYARRIGIGAEHGASARIASWLPLYHDMGLITCFFLPLIELVPLVAMSPFDWVKRPDLLLEVIARQRATHVWLPNFAYNFLATRTSTAHTHDLASLRAVVNCSEPVQDDSHRMFADRFAASGLRPNVLSTCYALAENTFAVTSGGIDRALVTEVVDGSTLAPGLSVVRSAQAAKRARTVVSSGTALPETSITIVDAEGRAFADGTVGEVEIASPSLFAGYLAGTDARGSGPRDGRFRTGDLGYLRDGELFVIGRIKDTIIIGGRNIHPQDVEAIVSTVAGAIPGRSVAVGVEDAALGTQRLVILAETAVADDEGRRQLSARIHEAVTTALDAVPSDIALVAHMSLLKSTSGKLSRSANRERYLEMQKSAAGASDHAAQRAPSSPAIEGVRACVLETMAANGVRAHVDFGGDTDLVREGVLDSFSLVDFQARLEERFGAAATQMIRESPDRFRTVHAIAAHIESTGGRSSPARTKPKKLGALRAFAAGLGNRVVRAASPARAEPARSILHEIAPQMRDVEAQPYEWVAYLMRRGQANYRSATLSSDEHGFRTTHRAGAPIAYAQFTALTSPKAVVLGNSFAYGVGTTHDARTFASALNEAPEARGFTWYNLAQRASVVLQERLAFELFAPRGVECVVWTSGINNLISLIVREGDPRNPAPFVGERQYVARMMPKTRLPQAPVLESRYSAMIVQLENDLASVASRMRGVGRMLFCLQPSASWIDKRWTSEERTLIDAFDGAGSVLQQAHHPRHLAPLHARFARDLEQICTRHEIDFLDANADAVWREERWLFIDRTHMTDAGHAAFAALVGRWLVAGGPRA